MSEQSTVLTPAALKPGAPIRLIPAGDFRTRDGRPEGLAAWRMDAATAQRLIAAHAQASDAFVIDYEHQTLHKEKNGQPAPAAGWFRRLSWKEGQGLYTDDVEWTAQASAMIEKKEYRYLSPVFRFDQKTGAVTGLIGAALTNFPALDGLVDLAAASAVVAAQPPSLPSLSECDIRVLGDIGLPAETVAELWAVRT